MPPEGTPLHGSKDAAAVKIFPPLIALGAILLGVLLQFLLPIHLGADLPPRVRYWVGGVIVGVAVGGLGMWAIVSLRTSGESELPSRPTGRIVERGPYRFTRNPLYLQLVLACIGMGVLLLNPWVLLLTPVCTWLLHRLAIVPEEEYLERKFGDEYLAYKSRVRRWL